MYSGSSARRNAAQLRGQAAAVLGGEGIVGEGAPGEIRASGTVAAETAGRHALPAGAGPAPKRNGSAASARSSTS